MARRPTLSPSKITTFLACPAKYRYQYLDSRGRPFMKAKSYFSFGSSLHRALERFHDSNDTGVTTTEELLTAYEESWIDAGYQSAEEMAEAFGEGYEILEQHAQEWVRRKTTAKTLFTERQFSLELEAFRLIGRIDRLDEHEDGRLEIVDYKSGRSKVEEGDVKNDIAMSIYQLLIRRKYPDRPVFATIYALRTGAQASAELNDAEIDQLQADIQKLGEEILSYTDSYWELRPSPKKICNGCDFLKLCSADPDFDASLIPSVESESTPPTASSEPGPSSIQESLF
jgi:RecB family exonuclease